MNDSRTKSEAFLGSVKRVVGNCGGEVRQKRVSHTRDLPISKKLKEIDQSEYDRSGSGAGKL